ncbi:MAG: sigma-70 family RNA polymerase sigma factor [Deltaproteobacteria bacterium]|nr:MAG: sigma-70 family RNA polymerase sigma factor [Deltaproteobacteria bacterium]
MDGFTRVALAPRRVVSNAPTRELYGGAGAPVNPTVPQRRTAQALCVMRSSRVAARLDAPLAPGASSRGPHVLDGRPEAILTILRSAGSASPDPLLGEVLEAFRRQWLALARQRYPELHDDLEDAVQSALVKLISREKLDGLKDVTRLESWARSLFVHTVLDLARESGRHRARRAYLASPDQDPEEMLRDGLPVDRPTPEEMTAYRERLEIVARCAEKLDVARMKFVEDMPEKDIALRQNLTRDGVAGQLKRIRRALRIAFGDEE